MGGRIHPGYIGIEIGFGARSRFRCPSIAAAIRVSSCNATGPGLIPSLGATGIAMLVSSVLTAVGLALA
ncbi:hypothetical protein [Gordonia oleivorans]|uniref:hypothetical protein n=1 Tax=Gordonia oleivorans TaxID=3156618 RepID=UPI003CCE27BE